MSNEQELWSARFFEKTILGDASSSRYFGNRNATVAMARFTLILFGLVAIGVGFLYLNANG